MLSTISHGAVPPTSEVTAALADRQWRRNSSSSGDVWGNQTSQRQGGESNWGTAGVDDVAIVTEPVVSAPAQEDVATAAAPAERVRCQCCYEQLEAGSMLECHSEAEGYTHCRRVICASCLARHVEVQVTSVGRVPRCPMCDRADLDVDVMRSALALHLGETGSAAYDRIMTMLDSLLLRRFIARLPNLRYCPNSACRAAFDVVLPSTEVAEPTAANPKRGKHEADAATAADNTEATAAVAQPDGQPPKACRLVICGDCQTPFCFQCRLEWHGVMPCTEYAKWIDDNVGELQGNSAWRRRHDCRQCPGCSAVTEKNEGCPHMTCSQCGTEYCWQCMKPFLPGLEHDGECVPIAHQQASPRRRGRGGARGGGARGAQRGHVYARGGGRGTRGGNRGGRGRGATTGGGEPAAASEGATAAAEARVEPVRGPVPRRGRGGRHAGLPEGNVAEEGWRESRGRARPAVTRGTRGGRGAGRGRGSTASNQN